MELYHFEEEMSGTPEELFTIVNDDEELKSWSPIFEGNDYLTEAERGVGARFITKLKVLNRTYRFRSEITEYEKNQHVEVKTVLKQGVIVSTFNLEPAAARTTNVHVTSTFDPGKRKYAFMLKGVKPIIKQVLDRQMKKLGGMAGR
ncbi:hypothetical protein GCM10022378_08280 [Salinicoccus jeotgali]|uniref:SRPBCC family protein n=1 Tax=Salinicoccus jeotgali TaxID=381634 RepID=A0ABP7ELN4_9STAP